jgi:uncharacterized protein (TIGR02646 family)
MREIHKGPEPKELTEYRALPSADYDGGDFTPVKDVIRTSLLKEQGHLCAYCMQRIDKGNMKVEHWHSRKIYKKEQLDYKNLLGCCKGNEGSPPKNQHCDTKKGNDDISFNPSKPEHHACLKIRYTGGGKIYSLEETFNCELNEILNLNLKRIEENRKEKLDGMIKVLSKNRGLWTRSNILREIKKWEERDSEGQFKEYNGIVLHHLYKILKRH